MTNGERLCQASVSARKPPMNMEPADRGLFAHEFEKDIPESRLLRLEDVTVRESGLLFKGLRLLPASFPSPRMVATRFGARSLLGHWAALGRRQRRRTFERSAVWIADTWSEGYFHWMTDALCRLYAVRGRPDCGVLLLPGHFKQHAYIGESLRAFGLQEVVYLTEPVRCRSLLCPSHVAPTGNYNDEVIRGVGGLVADFFGGGEAAGERVYISRRHARFRRIVNEDACEALLGEYGFRTYCFETLSFEQQVRVARSAKYLVSNHGAGLTNMLFMRPGCRALELRNKADRQNNCFFSLASAMRIGYLYQLCDPECPTSSAHIANLVVEVGRLRQAVERMLDD